MTLLQDLPYSQEKIYFSLPEVPLFFLFPKNSCYMKLKWDFSTYNKHTQLWHKKLFIYFGALWVCNILKTKYIFLPFEEEISTIEIDLAYLCVIIIRTKQLLQRIHYELSKSNLYHFMSFSPKRKYFYDVNKKVFILKKITTTKSERQLL